MSSTGDRILAPCGTDRLLLCFGIMEAKADATGLHVSIRILPKRDCLSVLSKQLYALYCWSGFSAEEDFDPSGQMWGLVKALPHRDYEPLSVCSSYLVGNLKGTTLRC